MGDQLTDLMEKAELAVGSCSGVLPDSDLETLISHLQVMRARLSYPDDVLVVALAGGTGSGKSSLLNALTGDDLVDVGGVRPTTSAAAAAIPEVDGSGFNGFLDVLGITERHIHNGPPVCLVDLPDTDSVQIDHRHRVDRLLPLVDLVVWVTDPEKYHDARLHHDYLRPLAEHSDRFIFVLNQIDRLSPGDSARVISHFEMALAEDGIESPTIVATAAAPVAGPPIGLSELVVALDQMGETRDFLAEKLVTDLAALSRTLTVATGSSVDFDRRASEAVTAAASNLVERDCPGASRVLVDFFDAIQSEVGGPIGLRIERLTAEVHGHVERIAGEIEPTPETRRWWRKSRDLVPDLDEARSRLATATVRPVRALLAKRAVALASVADLAVTAESLRRTSSR